MNGLFSKIFWLRKEKKNNYPLYKISYVYLRSFFLKKKTRIVIGNQSGTSFYYLLLFLTFRISRGFGIDSELPRFFRIKTFNILHITIITFFSNYLLIQSSRSKRKRSVYPLVVLRFLFDIFMFFSIFMDFVIIL